MHIPPRRPLLRPMPNVGHHPVEFQRVVVGSSTYLEVGGGY